MAWARRWLGTGVVGLSAWTLTGCASSLPSWAESPDESLSKTIASDPQGPRVARLQRMEGAPPVGLGQPMQENSSPATIAPPPPLPGTAIKPPPPLPGGAPIHQANLTMRGTVRVSVRAWVNGLPIFEDEVMQGVGGEFRQIAVLPEPQRTQRLTKVLNQVLENIIDSEVLYQEAIKKIKQASPTTLVKLKDVVDQEYEKSVAKMRKNGATEAQLMEIESVAKRMMERNLISTEYARSRIMDGVKTRIAPTEIRDYYNAHKNEFKTVDKIDWQNIFIPINQSYPSVAEIKRFAEEQLARCRTPDDFSRLMVYNEGSTKGSGEGLGHRRGEIQPRELEAVLFQLRSGEIGPVIPWPGGVHLVRVLKREYEGQMPLDHDIQNAIRKKLEGQLADMEYRRIVRELRARAVIQIEPRKL